MQEAVELAVEEELGEPEDEARWVPVDVQVVVREDETAFTADVLLTTGSGETARSLEASSCEELHQAVGLLIAIHVDPYGGDAVSEPELPPEPEPALPPEPESEPESELELEPVAPQETVEPRNPPELSRPPTTEPPAFEPERGAVLIRVGVGLTMGLLPRAAPSFELAGGWSRGHLRLAGHVDYLPPQLEEVSGGTITVQAWAAGARACGLLFARAVTVPLCGGFGAGAVHGSATGFDETGTDARVQAFALASAGVDWAIAPRFSFWARLDGGATVARPRFEIQGLGTVFAAQAWRAAATIGVGYDFL